MRVKAKLPMTWNFGRLDGASPGRHSGPMRDDWERLGEFVRRVRVDLGYRTQDQFAEAAKISPRTLRELEGGRPVAKRTLALIEAALQWGPGSAQSVLRGGQPDTEDTPAASPTAARAADEQNLQRILNASSSELVRMFREEVETLPGMTRVRADRWLVDVLEMRAHALRLSTGAHRDAS
jgi:transcriptional regulator with XRE-family HTH domain